MRRLILIALLLPSLLFAQASPVSGAGKTKVGGAGTSKIFEFHDRQTQGDTSDGNNIGDANGTQRIAYSFTAASSYNLRRIVVYFGRNGSPTFNIKFQVFSTTGSPAVPNAQIGSDSTTILASGSFSTSGTGSLWYVYFPSDIALTSGTRYWVVAVADGVGSGANNAFWLDKFNGTVVENLANATLAGSWTNITATIAGTLTISSYF